MTLIVAIFRVASLATVIAGFLCGARAYADDIVINKNYPIRNAPGGSNLSPPNVEATNECAVAVYVDGFVPHATVTVFLNGTTVIGGPVAPEFGFAAISVTHALHTGDKITATQTVNGVKSVPSAPMVVGAMPAKLNAPVVGNAIYACGQVVPVTGLTSGVRVEVRDDTANAAIGNGGTPNAWGNDWDPVGVAKLTAGHAISARQTACTGVDSPFSGQRTVNADPSPVTVPMLDAPVIGNDAVTANDLLTGADLQVFNFAAQIGGGFATGATNWTHVSPKIAAGDSIAADQVLCSPSVKSPPSKPVSSLTPPTLVAPICPGQGPAVVGGSTINATLVLLRNDAVSGYGGAGPGDVNLNLAPPAAFAQNDIVQVAEYIGNVVALSNKVKVECHDVLTYHNDNGRTGWNPNENTLTPANVKPGTFGRIATAVLDDKGDQVDAQPLIVTNQKIEGMGVHSVAYVATENNAVYAIDSFTAVKLKKVNLGSPVPRPLNCENNGPAVGINSTPTIDRKAGILYVMAYVLKGTTPTYELHALDLATLKDKHPPETVSAANALTSAAAYGFDASVQRQRSALLQANGNIYAGFAAFCDFEASQSRGWVLGWRETNLAPLGKTELLDKSTATSTFDCYFHAPWPSNHPCYLSSVWMSGFGIASDSTGALFFTTGNTGVADGTGVSFYDSKTNLAESLVKLSGDLDKVVDFFTPSNVNDLDQHDTDFGAGGVVVLPDQPGPITHLAVAVGKDANLYIVNRDTGQMGGFQNPNVPKSVAIATCPCDTHSGPSYFKGSDGVGRVVSSGGSEMMQWKVDTATSPALAMEASAAVTSGQDPGFFTSISSNGVTANTAIIWAVGRPLSDTNTHVTLQAFDGTASGGALKPLWSSDAGSWPNTGGNANIVPTVANGMVYVASDRQLQIFGLTRPSRGIKRMQVLAFEPEVAPPSFTPASGPLHWGTIRAVDGSHITLELRTGRTLQVDLSKIMPRATSDFGAVGRYLAVAGAVGPDDTVTATGAWRVKNPSFFGADRDK